MHEKTGRVELGTTLTDSGKTARDVDRHGEPVASLWEKKSADASRSLDLVEESLRKDLA
jgi:hypothetical protein